MELAKVTSKGQVTIPVEIRKKLGIREGDKILFIEEVSPQPLPFEETCAPPLYAVHQSHKKKSPWYAQLLSFQITGSSVLKETAVQI